MTAAETAYALVDANPDAREILNYLMNADPERRRRFVDYMTHDADSPLAERNELRALYGLAALGADDDDQSGFDILPGLKAEDS